MGPYFFEGICWICGVGFFLFVVIFIMVFIKTWDWSGNKKEKGRKIKEIESRRGL